MWVWWVSRSIAKSSAEIKHDEASRFIKVCRIFMNFLDLKFPYQVQVLYYVYCVAEDDELLGGCWQRDSTESPSCGNNQATQNTEQKTNAACFARWSLVLLCWTMLYLIVHSWFESPVRTMKQWSLKASPILTESTGRRALVAGWLSCVMNISLEDLCGYSVKTFGL